MNAELKYARFRQTETITQDINVMHKEDKGFISIVNATSAIKNAFVGNEIPQEGEVLELVVFKKEENDGSCTLVLKLRSAQK